MDNLRFIDTHCHFDFPPFSDAFTDSLALAKQNGVSKIIIPTVSVDNFARVWQLAQQHSSLYAAMGFHPLYLSQYQDQHIDILVDYLNKKDKNCVAIGEIGLDLYMQNPQFEHQQKILSAQLRLAKQFDLPVILHSRKSHDQLAAILRRMDVPARGVIHGFAGAYLKHKLLLNLAIILVLVGRLLMKEPIKHVM